MRDVAVDTAGEVSADGGREDGNDIATGSGSGASTLSLVIVSDGSPLLSSMKLRTFRFFAFDSVVISGVAVVVAVAIVVVVVDLCGECGGATVDATALPVMGQYSLDTRLCLPTPTLCIFNGTTSALCIFKENKSASALTG
jgi:hypothetical protein